MREILPELINQTLVLISSDEDEQQEVSCQMRIIHCVLTLCKTAGRTITEIYCKFGEHILGEILKAKSGSTDPHMRQAVSLIIGEIL